jgi:CubicO group peptidase (beta-lactamase class C family)
MKRWMGIAAALVVAAGVYALAKLNAMAGVGAGYMAKIACSEVFLAGRGAQSVIAGEFNDVSPVLDQARLMVDPAKKSVSGSVLGLGRSQAVYREGYGCTLARGGRPVPLPPLRAAADKPLPDARAGAPEMRSDVDYAAIDAAIDAAFADERAATRALLVIKEGAVVAERYADGFSAGTPLLSWSMAKSLTATMVGAAINEGFLDLSEPAPVAEWANDKARRAIAWNDLLQMQSGLQFSEVYEDPASDVSKMLFLARDAGGVAAKKKLLHQPGTYWDYSSGTTNLIQRTLRETLEANDADYHAFARDRIFGPIGAASFVMEPDASGTFIGSSFVYATARDWAKLGLLYLNDGTAGGVRILPPGWSRYVATPASASDRFYGAQFWLNHPGRNGREKYIPGVPDEAYLMAGHEGQYVLIIPDKRMIIVRAGMTRGTEPMPVVAPTFAAIYDAVR